MTGRGDRPTPCGFSPIAPSWEPRRRHAGTYDAAWARRRAPYLPKDFDRRFFNVAPAPLCFDRFLAGGEPVEAVGVSAREAVRFDLPRCHLRARFAIRRRWEEAPVQLQTIHLYPDDDEVALTFAACFSAGRRLLSISQARIDLERLALEAAA